MAVAASQSLRHQFLAGLTSLCTVKIGWKLEDMSLLHGRLLRILLGSKAYPAARASTRKHSVLVAKSQPSRRTGRWTEALRAPSFSCRGMSAERTVCDSIRWPGVLQRASLLCLLDLFMRVALDSSAGFARY